MASGHISRTRRPYTWLLRPDCDVQKVLANVEPSTHGTRENRSAPQRICPVCEVPSAVPTRRSLYLLMTHKKSQFLLPLAACLQ
jgi:hypothetical protein